MVSFRRPVNNIENGIEPISIPESQLVTKDKILEVFAKIYLGVKDKLYPNLNIEEHLFYKMLKKKLQDNTDQGKSLADIPANTTETPANVSCDDSFVNYLLQYSSQSNLEYFTFVLKFIFLFRESINQLQEKNNISLYTTNNNSEKIPEYCNEFITDFMEPNDYFDICNTDELIQIIQHFCHWLYIKGLTNNRLSLIN